MRALIEREAEHARAGRPAHIIIKNNAVADPAMIKALYRASQAGLPIDLIVRGVCCLRPGVPGISDHIRVRSVVGRFLEHSRIYYFENGGEPEVFIGSADLMERNLDRRVEVLCPVRDPELRQHLRSVVLDSLLRDTERALPAAERWDLRRRGSRRGTGVGRRQQPAPAARVLHQAAGPRGIGKQGTKLERRRRSVDGRGLDFAEPHQLEADARVGRIGEHAGQRLVHPRPQELLVQHQAQLVAVRDALRR